MFFAPTILALREAGFKVRLVCFSTGDFDGLGKTRVKELSACAKNLGIMQECLDKPDMFPDDSSRIWKRELVATEIQSLVRKYAPDILMTFDNYGVSGHLNHRSLYHGLIFYLKSRTDTPKSYALRSVSLLRKFTSYLDIFVSYIPVLYNVICGHSNDGRLVFISSFSGLRHSQSVSTSSFDNVSSFPRR